MQPWNICQKSALNMKLLSLQLCTILRSIPNASLRSVIWVLIIYYYVPLCYVLHTIAGAQTKLFHSSSHGCLTKAIAAESCSHRAGRTCFGSHWMPWCSNRHPTFESDYKHTSIHIYVHACVHAYIYSYNITQKKNSKARGKIIVPAPWSRVLCYRQRERR